MLKQILLVCFVLFLFFATFASAMADNFQSIESPVASNTAPSSTDNYGVEPNPSDVTLPIMQDENSPRARSGTGPMCKIGSNGTEDCVPYEPIGIDPIYTCIISSNGEQTCSTPTPNLTNSEEQPDLQTVQPKHSPNIDLIVADSIDKALETNPTKLFHVIIEFFSGKDESGSEYNVSYEFLNQKMVQIISDSNGIARKIDEQNNTIFADLPANQIDDFSKSWSIKNIKFDESYEMPYSQKILENQKISAKENSAITTDVSGKNNIVKISTNQDNNSISINSNGITAQTTEKVQMGKNGLKIAEKPVKILPNKAIEKVADQNATINEIELKIVNEIPKYEIKTTQKTKLFWIIPIEMQVKTTINAQTGTIDSTEKPWWSFLTG